MCLQRQWKNGKENQHNKQNSHLVWDWARDSQVEGRGNKGGHWGPEAHDRHSDIALQETFYSSKMEKKT